LLLNRESIAISCLVFALFAALGIKTYKGSKLTFVYVIAAVTMISEATNIVECILGNWKDSGINQKGITPSQATNFQYANIIFA
jgi:hypothetical protein